MTKKLVIPIFVLLAVLMGLGFWVLNRPLSPCVTTDSLAQALSYGGHLILVEDVCYEMDAYETVGELCDPTGWEPGTQTLAGKRILTIKLGDEYELAFYENGIAQAYYGYAAGGTRGNAWYCVPEITADSIAQYVRSHGTLREPMLGSGSWFTLNE